MTTLAPVALFAVVVAAAVMANLRLEQRLPIC
jgi:hypothetical protein